MQDRISYMGFAGVVAGVTIHVSTSKLPELSALFPRTIALALIAIGLIEIIRNFVSGTRHAKRINTAAQDRVELDKASREAKEGNEVATTNRLGSVLIFALSTIVYVALIPIIGYYVMTFAFLIALMLLLGIRNAFYFIGVPVILVALVYLTFTMQLSLPLPEGVLL